MKTKPEVKGGGAGKTRTVASKSSKSSNTKTAKLAKTPLKSTKVSKPQAVRTVDKPAAVSQASKNITKGSLRKWNLALAVVHALQGAAVLFLSTAKTFPVTASYTTVDPIGSEIAGHTMLSTAIRNLFDVNLAYVIAAFFFMSALAHLVVATVGRRKYNYELDHGMNRFRWFEYAASASTMLVAIAMLVGITDVATLGMIFALSAGMNLLGLVMESHNQRDGKVNWQSFNVGTFLGLAAWAVVAWTLVASNVYGSGKIPTFVYWIFGSIFVMFSSFAVNMYLQYKNKGQWKNYLYGERMYMVLSLVAKTALAWQVFAGALRP